MGTPPKMFDFVTHALYFSLCWFRGGGAAVFSYLLSEMRVFVLLLLGRAHQRSRVS